jgi:peptide/nickel transport system substrate-binding protein
MTSGFSPLARSSSSSRVLGVSVSLIVLLALALAGCGSNNNNAGGKHILTAIGAVSGSYTQDMSPFSPNVNVGILGIVYENLEFVNGITDQEVPMLATGHQFSSDNSQLTFTIRQGVKWSDGQAFTPADVAFTFNLLKQYPDADANGLWQHLSGVQAVGNTVVLTFQSPDPSLLPYVESTYIVPQHLWSNVGDPTKYINANPVGTGPMKLLSFSAQEIKYVKNPSYWNAGAVKVDELDYPIAASNNTALLEIASHSIDWTAVFDPAVSSAFVQKDPAHNFSYPVPVVPVMLVPNLKNPLLSQLPVRQAISEALDRQAISQNGEAGLEIPASPTGLMPLQTQFLDPKYNGQLPQFGAANPTQADQTLSGAGFTKGSDGYYQDAHGNKLSFSVTVPGDFSDYVADLQIAQQNLQAAGIQLKLNEVSDNDWRTDRASGNFDLIMTGGFFGPTPYYYFEPLLHSTHINQGANTTNWEGWNDPTTDQLLNQYAATSDPQQQQQAIQQISDIMANELPVITVTDAVQFFEYQTTRWTGWPTQQNPYAIGSAYPLSFGDNEQVILHLTPAS